MPSDRHGNPWTRWGSTAGDGQRHRTYTVHNPPPDLADPSPAGPARPATSKRGMALNARSNLGVGHMFAL